MTRVSMLVLLALALLAAPLAAEADRAPRIPRIGVVSTASTVEVWRSQPVVKAVLEGLEELRWVEGRDFVLDVRTGEHGRLHDEHLDRLHRVVASLVAQKVDVMLFLSCDAPFHVARQSTRTIPIVVGVCVDDLVGKGIVGSLARPGGNITGISLLTPELSARRLSLLKEVVPTLSRVTVLWNSGDGDRDFAPDWQELRAAAAAMAVTLNAVEVRSPADRESVLAYVIAREGTDGLLGFPDRTHYLLPRLIAGVSARTRLPGVYAYREVPEAGGLMSYGPNLLQLYRRVGAYVAKILSGANPADLPIEQPTKFELVINLKTAKALGLTIPPAVLARADEIIE
jgi:putative ABC transport system substrate-binding protein